MNINDLEKAGKQLKRLQAIDAEIKEIEKIGLLAANGCFRSSFELGVTDLSETAEKAPILDEDGSLIQGKANTPKNDPEVWLNAVMRFSPPFVWQDEKPQKTKHDHTLKYNLPSSTLLRILAALLHDLQAERFHLLQQLETMGVAV